MTDSPLPIARGLNSARYASNGKVISTGGYEPGVGYSNVTYRTNDFQFTKLFVFPSSLCFTKAGVIWDYPQHLTLYNTGTTPLNWTVTDNINWLLENPMFGGPLAPGAATLVHCFLDSTLTILPGTYLGHVMISAVGDSAIPVSACLIASETAPPISINMDQSGPWVVGAGGASFNYLIQIRNNTGASQTFQAWTKMQAPNCAWTDPVLGPFTLTIPGGWVVNKTKTVNFGPSLPAGIYRYQGSVGTWPNVELDTHSIWGMKLPWPAPPLGGENPIGAELWFCDNEPFFDEELPVDKMPPASFILRPCSPNPFNPTTAISYKLQAARYVSLNVYNSAGRLVATLVDGWRDVGTHEAVFDGSGLPSGIYFAMLSAGDFSQVQKIVLMK